MSKSSGGQIDTVMHESRVFPPSREFSSRARIKSLEEYQRLYDEAQANPEAFWRKLAREELHRFQPFDKVLNWQSPVAEWFVGGKTNASDNCLDIHLSTWRRNKGHSSLRENRAINAR